LGFVVEFRHTEDTENFAMALHGVEVEERGEREFTECALLLKFLGDVKSIVYMLEHVIPLASSLFHFRCGVATLLWQPP
jgi:hypothetical protein